MQVILKFAFASKHYQIIVDRALHLYPLYLHIILCCKKFFRNRSLSMPLEYYFIPMLITLIQKVKSKLKKKNLNYKPSVLAANTQSRAKFCSPAEDSTS